MAQASLTSDTEELVRCTRQLKRLMKAFERSARGIMRPLNKIVSAAENEAMETPRANALGILESLRYQDLGNLLRQLSELEGNLRHVSLRQRRASPEP